MLLGIGESFFGRVDISEYFVIKRIILLIMNGLREILKKWIGNLVF